MLPWMRRLAAQCTDNELERLMSTIMSIPFTPAPQDPPERQAGMTPNPWTPGANHCAEAALGVKFDLGKPDWSLLPWDALGPVVEVMMFGARKYGPDNWRDVPDAGRRYWSAAQRHLIAHLQGEPTDEESGLPHLAHAACCVLFLLALDQGVHD